MNILITGAWQQAKDHIAEIEAMGHKVSFLQYEKDELPCKYDEIEGVICNGLFLHHPIEKFTKLRYIQLTSAGYDRVPICSVYINSELLTTDLYRIILKLHYRTLYSNTIMDMKLKRALLNNQEENFGIQKSAGSNFDGKLTIKNIIKRLFSDNKYGTYLLIINVLNRNKLFLFSVIVNRISCILLKKDSDI